MEIYNIIVTFNRAAMLDKVLSHLSRNKFKKIIIVDNNSADNTADIVLKWSEKIKTISYFKMDTNTGATGGINFGLKYFCNIANDSDYALIHDDDSWPNFDCEDLLSSIEKTGNFDVGCFPVIHPSGELNRMNIPGICSFLSNPLVIFKKRRPDTVPEFNKWEKFDYCGFVGFMGSRKLFLELGLPNPRFFIYSDDTFYSYLCGKIFGGIKNLYFNKFLFVHDCKRSSGKTLLSGPFGYYEVRNKIIFLRRASPFWLLYCLVFLMKSLIVAPFEIRKIISGALDGFTNEVDDYDPIH